LTSFDDIPFEAIKYFVGEIVYGGRVTDEYDRRLLKTMLLDYISPEVIDNPKVEADSVQKYLDYVEGLPENDSPSIFGLN
jgi:dynein heavy chain